MFHLCRQRSKLVFIYIQTTHPHILWNTEASLMPKGKFQGSVHIQFETSPPDLRSPRSRLCDLQQSIIWFLPLHFHPCHPFSRTFFQYSTVVQGQVLELKLANIDLATRIYSVQTGCSANHEVGLNSSSISNKSLNPRHFTVVYQK